MVHYRFMFAPSPPLVTLADQPPPPPLSRCHSLFLDFDGTLVDLAERPDAVVVEPRLLPLLSDVAAALDSRIAIVSGRSIRQLDALLGPGAAGIAIAGSHGAERRTAGEGHVQAEAAAALADLARAFEQFADAHPGVIAEVKSHGVALHFRLAPQQEQRVTALAEQAAEQSGLVLQRGKMMVEVRVAGDKGAAVQAMMALPPFAGSVPLFCGDDVTDEDGFAAVRALGGGGILIGDPRESGAVWRLPDVAALHAWLATAMTEPL